MPALLTRLCLLLLVALSALPAGAQEPVADFSHAPGNGTYAFASATPKTLADLVKSSATGEPASIVGHLFLPAAGGAEKVPAVVLIHGSGGIYNAMLDYWPKRFNAAGYAVLAVDGFGPRGVKSTAEDQSQVPFGADVADAYSALRLLASHPRIDPARIAIMGFSRGGIATWRTAVERIAAAQTAARQVPVRFAAHIPVYAGGCSGTFRLAVKPGVFGKAPMLWVHGEADDYTAIGPCRDYAGKIAAAGTPAEFVAIPGAHHKFDMDEQRNIFIRGAQKSLESCPLEVDIDTLAAYDRTTGQRLVGEAYQDVLRKQCGALGAHIEGNSAARDTAAQAILGFLQRTLGR